MTRHTPGTVTTAGYEMCGYCRHYLSTDNPGVELWSDERSDSRRVLCLHCVNVIRVVLMAQAEEDKARER